MQNIIEKRSHSPSIISAQLRTRPADSISIPDGGTSFPSFHIFQFSWFSEIFITPAKRLRFRFLEMPSRTPSCLPLILKHGLLEVSDCDCDVKLDTRPDGPGWPSDCVSC